MSGIGSTFRIPTEQLNMSTIARKVEVISAKLKLSVLVSGFGGTSKSDLRLSKQPIMTFYRSFRAEHTVSVGTTIALTLVATDVAHLLYNS